MSQSSQGCVIFCVNDNTATQFPGTFSLHDSNHKATTMRIRDIYICM